MPFILLSKDIFSMLLYQWGLETNNENCSRISSIGNLTLYFFSRYNLAYSSNFSDILDLVVENNYQLFMVERLILMGARTFIKTYKEDDNDLSLTDDPKKNTKNWQIPVYTMEDQECWNCFHRNPSIDRLVCYHSLVPGYTELYIKILYLQARIKITGETEIIRGLSCKFCWKGLHKWYVFFNYSTFFVSQLQKI